MVSQPATQGTKKKASAAGSVASKAVSNKPKSRQHIKASARATSDDEGSQDDDQLDEEDAGSGNVGVVGSRICWTDPELTWSLISAIEEDTDIKRALYAPPGGNTSMANVGGKAKTDFHAELAIILFEDHEKYRGAFAPALSNPNTLAQWGMKIKNRLKGLEKQTREHISEMGKTGAGLTGEEELDMALDSELTNAWFVIKKKSPWFWNMKALICQHPNVILVGVGNTKSEVDVHAILGDADEASATPTSDADQPTAAPTEDQWLEALYKDESDSNHNDADLELGALSSAVRKRRASSVASADGDCKVKPKDIDGETATPAKKKASQGSSKSSLKKLKMADNFSDIAVAEETTRQKNLNLQILKAQRETVKYKAKMAAKVEKERLKAEKVRLQAEMLRFKLRQEHELKMARLQQGRSNTDLFNTGPSMTGQLFPEPVDMAFGWPHPVENGGGNFGLGGNEPSAV